MSAWHYNCIILPMIMMNRFIHIFLMGCLIFSLSLAACGGSKKKGELKGDPGESAVTESILLLTAAPKGGKSQLYMMKPGESNPVKITDNGKTNSWLSASSTFKIWPFVCSDWQFPALCLLDSETKSFKQIPWQANSIYPTSPMFSYDDSKIVYTETSESWEITAKIYDFSSGEATGLTDINSQLLARFSEPALTGSMLWFDNNTLLFEVHYKNDSGGVVFDYARYRLDTKELKMAGFNSDTTVEEWGVSEGKAFFGVRTSSGNKDLSLLKSGSDALIPLAQNAQYFACKHPLIARQQTGSVTLSSYDTDKETETALGTIAKMPVRALCSEDGKRAVMNLSGDNQLLLINLESGEVLQNNVGNGNPLAINEDGSFFLFRTAEAIPTLGATSSYVPPPPVFSAFLVNAASGEKMEIPGVSRYHQINFLEKNKFGYIKGTGETNELVFYSATGKTEEKIANALWWQGMGGGNYVTYAFKKNDESGMVEFYYYAKDAGAATKVPMEETVFGMIGEVQMPKGTYEKWKAFADEKRNDFTIASKENRPPTCFAGWQETVDREVEAGETLSLTISYDDPDFEDALYNYFDERLSISTNPGNQATIIDSEDRWLFNGNLNVQIATAAEDGGKNLTFTFQAKDSKEATGNCTLNLTVLGEVPPEAVCGNGTLDEEEDCDDGNRVDDDLTCTNICTLPACGDGIIQAMGRETCDDGNSVNGDGCNNLCQTETLTAPSTLTATAASTTTINLTWTDRSTAETGFKIERKTGMGGEFVQIALTTAGVVIYTDTGRTIGVSYTYRIRATNGTTDSAYSDTASVMISEPVPAAPSGLTVTGSSSTSIRLQWTDNSTNETGFKLERSTTSATSGFTTITTTGANVTFYTNSSLTGGTRYYYRVKATNGAGDSAYSNTVDQLAR